MPVPGAGPAPTTPIGFLKENPKSKQRQLKVVAAIAEGEADVRELEPLLTHRDKDLVRAATWVAANTDKVEPRSVEPRVLPRIADSDKRTAVAVVEHLAAMDLKDRDAAVFALGDTELARHITELSDARPRELKEALNGDDSLRARVAVAEVIRRGNKGEALLYEARSQKDAVVSDGALEALHWWFTSGELKPRARIDRFWLWRQKFSR